MLTLIEQPSAIQADGSVQIGDGLVQSQPADLTYNTDKFGNAIKAAVFVAEVENTQPALPAEPGPVRLAVNRTHLKGLLCLPESSLSPDESGIEKSS
jgi:hypothetical protein